MGLEQVSALCGLALALCHDESVQEVFPIDISAMSNELRDYTTAYYDKIKCHFSESKGALHKKHSVLLIQLVHDAVVVLFERYVREGKGSRTGPLFGSEAEKMVELFYFTVMRNKAVVHDVNELQSSCFYLSPDGSRLIPKVEFFKVLSVEFFLLAISFCKRYSGLSDSVNMSPDECSALKRGLHVPVSEGSLTVRDIVSVAKSEDKERVGAVANNILGNVERREDLYIAGLALDMLLKVENDVRKGLISDPEVYKELSLVYTVTFYTRVYRATSEGVRCKFDFSTCEARFKEAGKESIFERFKRERAIAHHSIQTNQTGFLFAHTEEDSQEWNRVMTQVVHGYWVAVQSALKEDECWLAGWAGPSELSALKEKVSDGRETYTYNADTLKKSRKTNNVK